MTRNELNREYFDWMYRLVCEDRYSRRPSHRRLLRHLHTIQFVYSIALDDNRSEDGMDLRYRFGHEHTYTDTIIAAYLDDKPCSVLEMLIALAVRCEEHIMDDPDIGNRTGQWFWSMLDNLGLDSMTDSNFDVSFVDNVIAKFLNREYKKNGEGGLFTVKNCTRDLRTVEIWYQMCWYLDKIL